MVSRNCSMRPAGRRTGLPGGVRDVECSPICRVHSGLVPFSHIYLSIYLSLRITCTVLPYCNTCNRPPPRHKQMPDRRRRPAPRWKGRATPHEIPAQLVGHSSRRCDRGRLRSTVAYSSTGTRRSVRSALTGLFAVPQRVRGSLPWRGRARNKPLSRDQPTRHSAQTSPP